MYLPSTYEIALLFMIGSMVCWGSWANTMKLSQGYRFQLFYWDYLIGLLVGSLAWGLTLGAGVAFLDDFRQMRPYSLIMALVGGAVFNVANLLLVAAIEIAGMAVAFPVGIGLALIVGAIGNYVIDPHGNPYLLFGGICLVLIAIVCDSLAYRSREKTRSGNLRGIVISLVSGLLMGSFYPFVSKAMSVEHAPGPYATGLAFVVGTVLCSFPVNYLFMRRPLDGQLPVAMNAYRFAPTKWHLAGVLGGIIWITGTTLNFAASRVHFVGPAISYSIGQGATLVSALWGVFIWREFPSPSFRVKTLLFAMFTCFIVGLMLIAVAPLFV